ncbi:hypothetical protein ACO22_05915, partial [Paracoccidioides brasiliensis]
ILACLRCVEVLHHGQEGKRRISAMGDRRSDSYDGEVKEADVVIGGKKIDSKTAQQLSSSGRRAQDTRIENKPNRSLNGAGAKVAAELARERMAKEAKGEQQRK